MPSARRVRARRVGVLIVAGLALSALLFTVLVVWPEPTLTVPPRTRLAFVGVTVVDIESSGLVADQTVLIDGDRIAIVGPSPAVALPPATRVIQGRGRFLLPAFWDMHAHVYAFAPILDLPLPIAYGVTNVRDMLSCPASGDPFIACPEAKRQWTREALDDERVGPRIVASTSFMANGPGTRARLSDVPVYFETSTPAEAREFARHFAGKVEAITVYDGLPRDVYLALADEARRLGLDLVGHRPHAVPAAEAAAVQKSLEHARFLLHESFAGADTLRAQAGTPVWREDRRRMVDEHDPKRAASIFDVMVRHGTWYVPTHLTRWSDAEADTDAVRMDPRLRYVHPLLQWAWREDVDAVLAADPSPEGREAHRAFYRKGLELTGRAHRAGVRVLAGTDYLSAGPDLHRELQQLVLAGLQPADALRAATLSPAEYFDLDDQFGRVAPGYMADLVLLDANPLEDIGNSERIAAVVFNGRLHDRTHLDMIDAHVRRQARSWTVAAKILWAFIKQPVDY